jgi:hypothetical protein
MSLIPDPDHWKEPFFSGKVGSPKFDTIVEILDKLNGLLGNGFKRYFWGGMNCGDNVVTDLFTITTGTYPKGQMSLKVELHLILNSSVSDGYVAVHELWVLNLASYWETVWNCRSNVTNRYQNKVTSASAAFADVGLSTVTVTISNNVFTCKVQSDHTGTSGGDVLCDYWLDIYCSRPVLYDPTYVLIEAAPEP